MRILMLTSLSAVALLIVLWFSKCGLFLSVVLVACLAFSVFILWRKPASMLVTYILAVAMLIGGLILLWAMSWGIV
jgi:hypothetical protein